MLYRDCPNKWTFHDNNQSEIMLEGCQYPDSYKRIVAKAINCTFQITQTSVLASHKSSPFSELVLAAVSLCHPCSQRPMPAQIFKHKTWKRVLFSREDPTAENWVKWYKLCHVNKILKTCVNDVFINFSTSLLIYSKLNYSSDRVFFFKPMMSRMRLMLTSVVLPYSWQTHLLLV